MIIYIYIYIYIDIHLWNTHVLGKNPSLFSPSSLVQAARGRHPPDIDPSPAE